VAGIPIAPGTDYEEIAVRGAGGPPRVLLRGPHGPLIPPARAAAAGAPAVAFSVKANSTTYVMLPHPRAGNWTVVQAAGSHVISQVRAARGFAQPSIHARVVGRGRSRRLKYHVPGRRGLAVTFIEQGSGVYHVIGSARGAHGSLRFTPADAPAGRRVVYAILAEDGLPFQRLAVTRYTAPGPVIPGRVHRLRVSRHGKTFRVHFGRAANASRYLVRISASDGRHLLRIARGPGTISLSALGYRDGVLVMVRGVSHAGRQGPAVHARGVWVSHVLACASVPRRRRHRHHC
jgi:hypothetical protein